MSRYGEVKYQWPLAKLTYLLPPLLILMHSRQFDTTKDISSLWIILLSKQSSFSVANVALLSLVYIHITH